MEIKRGSQIISVVIFAKYIERNTLFCRKMTKFWVVVVLIGKFSEIILHFFFTKIFSYPHFVAISTISQQATENYDEFGISKFTNKLNCKNTSAIVLEKQETLYQEFMKCVQNTVDIKQMNQDIRFMVRTIILALKFNSTLSEMQTSSLRLYSQRSVFHFLHTLSFMLIPGNREKISQKLSAKNAVMEQELPLAL